MSFNATSFKPGHKAHPNSYKEGTIDYRKRPFRNEHQRLKNRFIRELKAEFGPELTASQKEHIALAGEYKARLVKGEKLDDVTAVMLGNALRRELAVLSGD